MRSDSLTIQGAKGEKKTTILLSCEAYEPQQMASRICIYICVCMYLCVHVRV